MPRPVEEARAGGPFAHVGTEACPELLRAPLLLRGAFPEARLPRLRLARDFVAAALCGRRGVRGAWSKLDPAGDERPEGRDGHFFVHDAKNERLVIFRGDHGGSGWAPNVAEDAWALELSEDPPRGARLPLDLPTVGRRDGDYALDPVGHRMLVCGGMNDGQTSMPGLYAYDLVLAPSDDPRVVTEPAG